MEARTETPREIAVPVGVFEHLRRELSKEAGALATIHALHAAGYACGETTAPTLVEDRDGGVASMGQDEFWTRLASFFSRRGWGTLAHDSVSPAVSVLASADWGESTGTEPDPEGACTFTTGFLSGMLSGLAGGPVAVLEVECRTRGNDRCAFAFGSEHAVHELYGHMLEGADLESAVAAL